MTLLKIPATSAKSAHSQADEAWLRMATQATALQTRIAELLTGQLPKNCRLQSGIYLQILLYTALFQQLVHVHLSHPYSWGVGQENCQ